MDVKIYIGSNETLPTPTTMNTIRYKLEGTGNPSNGSRFEFDMELNGVPFMNINKTFGTSSSLIQSIRGTNSNVTMSNLLTNLQTYNNVSTPTITYTISTASNAFGYKDIYADVDVIATDTASINITWNNTSSFNIGAPYVIATFSATQSTTFTRFDKLDLYNDETINLTSKLSDIEKLSNIFTDFTNTFTIPATDNNSNLFKHYYDIDIYNTFNANIRVLGYLEIDTFPLRYGKIQLEQCIMKEGRPESYKITFYGGLIQLSDLFGDDTIDKLDYKKDTATGITELTPTWSSLSQFNFDYTGANFINSINLGTFMDGHIITPMIAYANRDWNYGNGDAATDISTTDGAIQDQELFQAIRVMKIIEAIETKYDISFSRHFLSKPRFMNLFLWMNNSNTERQATTILITNPLVDVITPVTNVIVENGEFIDITTYKYNQGHGANVERVYVATYDYFIYPNSGYENVDFNIVFYDEAGSKLRSYNKSDLAIGNTLARFTVRSGPNVLDNPELITHKVKVQVECDYTFHFSCNFRGYHSYYTTNTAGGTVTTILERKESDSNSQQAIVYRKPELLLPKTKVIDFIQGLMKMFKLIIRPITGSNFYLNTLDGYYAEGNILDITDYTDMESVTIDRPVIYKTISFKYQTTNNYPGVKFRQINDPAGFAVSSGGIGYGDLKSIQPYVETKDELLVELPFENMMFERMSILYPTAGYGTPTNISIGQSIQSDDGGVTFTKNNSKPILFYNNGIANNVSTPFNVKFRGTNAAVAYNYIIGNTDDELTNQITSCINWGTEIDPWHGIVVYNSLFLNHWKNWIDTIYSLKQRKFNYTAYLPPRYIEELSLNDRIVIGDHRYKINDYTINLTNGKTTLNLITDIYDSYQKLESPFTGSTFSWSGYYNYLYLTDFTDANADGSYFLYGSFATYNGLTAPKVIKMRKDGLQDLTFNTNLGGPNSEPYSNMRLHRFTDDSLLVAGYYSSYNGTSGYGIRKLHPNGSIDTSLTPRTFGKQGGYRYTENCAVQTDGKIILTGLFSSYDGNASKCLVRINPDGSYDNTFVVGSTGFNNTTTDGIVNSDGSIYVAGYFTSYNGTTCNGIVKLTATGSVDTSFVLGTGFSPSGGGNSMCLLPTYDDSNSVYVAGYTIDHYKGATAGRVIKLKSNGDVDTSFDIGTGVVTGEVGFIRYTANNERIFMTGTFSQFNGQSTNNAVIVNTDGSIYQTFPQTNYGNLYNVGNDVYGIDRTTFQLTKLTSDLQLQTYRFYIQVNAGARYYGIGISSNSSWTATKVDIGWGTDWVDILTPSGVGSTEVELYVQDKTAEIPPSVYLERKMAIKIKSGDIEKWVTIRQTGL